MRRGERDKQKALSDKKLTVKLASVTEKLEQRMEAEVDKRVAGAEQIFDEAVRDEKRKTATARKRARDAEYARSMYPETLARAQHAEKRLKTLEAMMDEEEEETEEEEEEEEGDMRGSGKEAAVRRGADGRFEGMPDELRPIHWAQLGRRVCPSAVGPNIQDVLSVFAPEVEIEHATDRQAQIMRGEVRQPMGPYCSIL